MKTKILQEQTHLAILGVYLLSPEQQAISKITAILMGRKVKNDETNPFRWTNMKEKSLQ